MMNVPNLAELEREHGLYLARIMAIQRLRSDGYSYRQIGRALGLSHEWVRQLSTVTIESVN